MSRCALGQFFNALVVSVAQAVEADPLDAWQLRSPLPPGISLNAVSYGNGLWVGVGYAGRIATSPDGINWTVRSSGADYDLSSISYGNGLWVAVGSEGLVFSPVFGWYNKGASGMILTSPDGIRWTARTSGTSNLLTGISYGNGLWAAVGEGKLLTSTDGVLWTVRSDSSGIYSCIGYGNGRWGTGAWDSFWKYSRISTRTLPVWRSESVSGKQDYYLGGISYGNGQWLAVGDSGTILTSPDAKSWTRRTSGTLSILMGVSYGNGLWMAVADDGAILTSGQTSGQPALSITVSRKNAVVSWSADAAGFVLETTTDLAAPQNWTPVNITPVIANSQNRIADAISGSARFYRLRKP